MGRGQCVAIVTGATRGFGQSLSVNFAKRMEQFAEEVIMVLHGSGTNRSSRERLRRTEALVTRANPKVRPVCIYLDAKTDGWVDRSSLKNEAMQTIHKVLDEDHEHVFLFNNVGGFGSFVGHVHKMHTKLSQDSFREFTNLNLLFPMWLTSIVLDRTKATGSRVRIVNTSSLAALEPVPSWAGYCMAKASMDMFHQVVARENAGGADVKTLNYAPGPMDTDLHQEMLLNEDVDPTVHKMHSEMEMVKADVSASRCMDILLKDEFVSGTHIDFFDS